MFFNNSKVPLCSRIFEWAVIRYMYPVEGFIYDKQRTRKHLRLSGKANHNAIHLLFFPALSALELRCLINSRVPYLQQVIKSEHNGSVQDKESATDAGPV